MTLTAKRPGGVLGQIDVRLLEPYERAKFDQFLIERHDLHSASVGGRSLRYVAELNGEWVALLVFSSASPHLKARDKWIGWSARQRARRLDFVVNNSRYLVLSDRHQYPNMASRVLALCLKRLDADWREVWGQPVLMVESFVDESLHRGTAYRACGFERLGLTAGFSRCSRDFYVENGNPKQLYVRALRKDAADLLRKVKLPEELAAYEKNVSGPCSLPSASLGTLLDVFKSVGDPRRGHGLRHPQFFVLACATVAMLMGGGGYQAFEDICGKLSQAQLRALGCRRNPRTSRYSPPSDTTFFRVLNGIDPCVFDRVVGEWLLGCDSSVLEQLAVDGKVLRGSGRTDGKALQLLSAVTHRLRVTVAQIAIEEKSNEIPALKPMLDQVPRLEGVVITADAMQCQQKATRYIAHERGAEFMIGLKGNQEGILERAQLKLASEFFSL